MNNVSDSVTVRKSISCNMVSAYTQCQMKAYLLIKGIAGATHDYISILEEETNRNRASYLDSLKNGNKEVKQYSLEEMQKGSASLIAANITFEDLEAYADVLLPARPSSKESRQNYFPVLVIGTHKISKAQKTQLGFAGYVLSKVQKISITLGTFVVRGSELHNIDLEKLYRDIESSLKVMRGWIDPHYSDPPATILNDHCPLCQFHNICEAKCIESDHLSLLNRISTKKQVDKFERKGIFTVNQLSFLYRPRRQRKRSRKPPSVQHSLELQALVLRLGKIYLLNPPSILRNITEIFLDIEGIPDRQSYYLIGLVICNDNSSEYHSFWADDKSDDEKDIWQKLINILNQHAGYPIYHYGNYEAKAIEELGKRYDNDTSDILKRLVNVNTYIYGKVYFPLRTNGLKDMAISETFVTLTVARNPSAASEASN